MAYHVLIWGTGIVAERFIKNGINGHILGFIQTHKYASEFKGMPVYGIDELPADYDYIIVANTYVSQIHETCIDKGIDLDKVIFIRSEEKRIGITDLNLIKEIFSEKNYTDYCGQFNLTEGTFFHKDMERYKKIKYEKEF